MLRISQGEVHGAQATLRLEGQLLGPWVAELRRACRQLLDQGYRPILDVAGLSYADREGLATLHGLINQEVSVINCPLFLAAQLKGPV